jgi:hypothetical protein
MPSKGVKPMSIFQSLTGNNNLFYFATQAKASKEKTLDLAVNHGLIIRAAYQNREPRQASAGAKQLRLGSKIILCYGGGDGGLYLPLAELTIINDDQFLKKIPGLPFFGILNDPTLVKKVADYGYEKDPILKEFTAIGVKFDRRLTSSNLIKKPNPRNAFATFDQVRVNYPHL